MKQPKIGVEVTLQEEKIEKIELYPAETFQFTFRGKSSDQLKSELKKWLESYAEKKAPAAKTNWFNFSQLPAFTVNVLHELMKVGFGFAKSYLQIAQAVNAAKASRAVGGACARNPFPLMIPCHRILASDGSLGGFAFGLPMKKMLLDFEKR